jgi:hypothetical protein
MVDAAIWCDYFVNNNVSAGDAARATAYLFKVPEGEAKGVDPGFFHQMKELDNVLEKTTTAAATGGDIIALGLQKGIITEEQAVALKGLK